MKESDIEKIHLRDFINVLIRRRAVVLISFLTLVLTTTIMSLRMHPTYESTAIIQLEEEKKVVSPLPQFFEDIMRLNERVITQVEILKSRTLSERVAKRLNLQFQMEPEDRMYHLSLKGWTQKRKKENISKDTSGMEIKSIALGDNPRTGEYKGVFSNSNGFIIYDENGNKIGNGEIGKLFSGVNFSFVIEGSSKEGKSFKFRILSQISAARSIMNNLQVTPVRDTSLIKIIVNWNNPTMAKEIANGIVEEYKEITVFKKTRETSQVLSFIEGELDRLNKDLVKAEEKLENFKKEKGFVTLEADATSALDQIARYEKDYKTMESYRKQAEIVLAGLEKPGLFVEKEALFSMGAGLNNPLIIDLGRKLTELNVQKSSLDTLLKKEHPKILQIEQEIADVKKRIIGEVKSQISSIKVSEENLKASMKKYEARIQSLPAAEKELFDIMRVVKVGQELSSYLLQKHGELSVSKASELGNIWVVDTPIIQSQPVKPNVKLNILLAVITGIALSIGLAFFTEYIDLTVKTPEELQKITDLPYLGAVFHFISDRKKLAGELKMLEDPHSHIAEAFRVIRTNLLFTTLGEAKKFFLVTSAGVAEGKTFVTANLAVALAQSGKRVLVVDADLRKPRIQQIFKVERSPGLTNILVDREMDYSNLPIKRTLIENLDILSSGDHPPNPSELLGSERMERFLSLIRERYDYVLFDSPPTFLASDSFILAQKVDGVIFVARSGRVEKDLLKESLDRYSRLNGKVMGLVFNDAYREGGKYYYYKYHYYYGDGDGRSKKSKKVLSSETKALPSVENKNDD